MRVLPEHPSVMIRLIFSSVLSYFAFTARLGFCALLLHAAVLDAKRRHVSASLQKCCVLSAVAGSFDPDPGVFLIRTVGAAFFFLLLFSVYILSRGKGLGGADVKIVSLSVLVFGFFKTAGALLWGCSLGLFFEIVRPRPPNTKSDGIPVITFFVLGEILNHVFI